MDKHGRRFMVGAFIVFSLGMPLTIAVMSIQHFGLAQMLSGLITVALLLAVTALACVALYWIGSWFV